MTSEAKHLEGRVKKLETQMKKATVTDDVREQFEEFITKSRKELAEIEEDLASIADLSKRLAAELCEDESTFKVEDLLETMRTFCERVKKCTQENAQRKIQEEKAAKRKIQQEELKKKRELGNKIILLLITIYCH